VSSQPGVRGVSPMSTDVTLPKQLNTTGHPIHLFQPQMFVIDTQLPLSEIV